MPVLFIGHGSPMNAIEDNEVTRTWKRLGERIPTPKLILCISAHWVTRGTAIMANENPKTIYDFSGFPEELYQIQYNAKGSLKYAERIKQSILSVPIRLNKESGYDHGTWSVLVHIYPKADIPVLQLSLDWDLSPEKHFQIGKELSLLRNEGILILGSGNIVHNLSMLNPDVSAYPWAVEFDTWVKQSLEKKDIDSLIQYQKQKSSSMAVPTSEHYLPLLYSLGASENEKPRFFNEIFTLGSISMTCVAFGI